MTPEELLKQEFIDYKKDPRFKNVVCGVHNQTDEILRNGPETLLKMRKICESLDFCDVFVQLNCGVAVLVGKSGLKITFCNGQTSDFYDV